MAMTLTPQSVFYYNRLTVELSVSLYIENGSATEPMYVRYALGDPESGPSLGVIVSAIPPHSGRVLSVPVASGDGLHADQGGHFQVLEFH